MAGRPVVLRWIALFALVFSLSLPPTMSLRTIRPRAMRGLCRQGLSTALQRKNAHPRDELVQFSEKEHRYAYESVPMKWSVTSLVQEFFQGFDSRETARKMMAGSHWPRPEYCHACGSPFTEEEVIAKWERIGEAARSKGTEMHSNIEKALNGVEIKDGGPEMEQFRKFKAERIDAAGITPFRTEWRIAAPDLSLAGSVDFVGLDQDNNAVIMDWKRSKNLSSPYQKNNAKPPIQHMPDCELSKYLLQLNLYRFILEKYYGMRVSKMVLGFFHPSLPQPFVWNVPILTKETEKIVEQLKAEA